MNAPTKQMLTTAELLELLGVTDQSLRNWRKAGLISAPVKKGGLVFYDAKQVRDDLLANPQLRVLPDIFKLKLE